MKKVNTVRYRQLAEKAGVVFTWLGMHLSQLFVALQSDNLNCHHVSVFFSYDLFFFSSSTEKLLLN